MKKLYTIFIVFAVASAMFAQELKRVEEPTPKELQFIGYSFTRMTATNISPTNEILQGQVIGRLFGQNSTSTIPRTSLYLEQRFVPFFVYKPSILDGTATFRALFKIDYTMGDQAYGVGNNRGGAINAGQINLQTLLANVDIRADEDWNVVVGLQRLFDNVRDPNVTTVSSAQNGDYKLSYWGTQAPGINVFGKLSPVTQIRAGYFQLWENEISRDDDVALWMLDVNTRVAPLTEVGADLWYVYDRGKSGGGISTLGQGLTSALAEYNGATRIHFPGTSQKYEADLMWAGVHGAYNKDFMVSRWWADGFFMANFGKIDSVGETTTAKAADVFGFAINASLQYKYGMTANDKISFEALYTSGDKNDIKDGTLNSVITGNVYGSPVGIYSAHRSLILFPDPQVINRYYSVVHDISNMGYGVTGFFLNFSKDLIPNRFNAKMGLASALSNVELAGGNSYMGTEINLEFKYNIKVFLTVTASMGYCALGGFFDAPQATYDHARPKDPWVFFTTLNWLMF